MNRIDEEKSQIRLGLIAHEIKSPIAATIQILQTVERLLTRDDDAKVRRMVKRAIKRATSALDLSRDLMEYLRLDHPEKKLINVVNPVSRIRVLLDRQRELAASRNIAIVTDLACDSSTIPLSVYEFDLIAGNVISNAIRYSKREQSLQHIWIALTEDADHIIFMVRDEGIGMSDQDRERIFSEFYRSEYAKEQTISGSGLGMAIVKKIIDENGASIECQSKLNVGTTFTIRFPKVDSQREKHDD